MKDGNETKNWNDLFKSEFLELTERNCCVVKVIS